MYHIIRKALAVSPGLPRLARIYLQGLHGGTSAVATGVRDSRITPFAPPVVRSSDNQKDADKERAPPSSNAAPSSRLLSDTQQSDVIDPFAILQLYDSPDSAEDDVHCQGRQPGEGSKWRLGNRYIDVAIRNLKLERGRLQHALPPVANLVRALILEHSRNKQDIGLASTHAGELWRKYLAISNNKERTQLLRGLSNSCITILVHYIRTRTGDETTAGKRVIQITRDMLSVGRSFCSKLHLNSYLTSLLSVRRYRSVISTFFSLKADHHPNAGVTIGTSAVNCVIAAYDGLDQVVKARQVFELIRGDPDFGCPPNVTSYVLVFRAVARQREPDVDYLISLVDGVAALLGQSQGTLFSGAGTTATMNILLKSACSAEIWVVARHILASLERVGAMPDQATFSIIFSNFKRIHEDGPLLERLYRSIRDSPDRAATLLDTVTYTQFIKYFSRCGRPDLAVEILNESRAHSSPRRRPNMHTYSTILHGCLASQDYHLALDIYEQMRDGEGLHPNQVVLTSVVTAHTRSSLAQALERISEAETGRAAPSMRHYNIVICNYCRRGDIDRALEMYRRIPSTLNPDVVTYSALFSMYIQVGKRALKGARFGSGSGETTRLGRLASVAVTPRLHKALLDEADHPRHILNDALSSANKFPHSVYNAMIGGLAVFHDFASAQRAYDHMTQVAGLDPDDRTYAALIYTFLRRADVDSAQRVFETIEDNGIVPNLVVCNALVHGFARAGYIKQAFEVYRYMVGFMPCPSFSDESGFSEVAVEEQCQADGEAVLPKFEIKVKPDNFTYFALIKALLYEKRPEDALALYDEMFEVQVVPDTITSAMLADGLEWCGKPEAADRVLMYRNIRINRLLREMKDSVCSEEH